MKMLQVFHKRIDPTFFLKIENEKFAPNHFSSTTSKAVISAALNNICKDRN